MARPPLPAPDTAALTARALRVCTMLRNWPDAVLARVTAGSHLERYARGMQVMARDPQRRELLAVVSGSLEVSGVNASGAKFVLSMLGAGEIVGLVRLLEGVEPVYDYHAHENTLVVHIPAEHLRSVLDDRPALWKDVALLALSRQQDSIATLQRRSFRRTDQSLAEAVLRLVQMSGHVPAHRGALTLRVSQSDLAAMVSVSRQTINKELRQLAERGILSVAYGELTVHDLPALAVLANTGEVQDHGPGA